MRNFQIEQTSNQEFEYMIQIIVKKHFETPSHLSNPESKPRLIFSIIKCLFVLPCSLTLSDTFLHYSFLLKDFKIRSESIAFYMKFEVIRPILFGIGLAIAPTKFMNLSLLLLFLIVMGILSLVFPFILRKKIRCLISIQEVLSKLFFLLGIALLYFGALCKENDCSFSTKQSLIIAGEYSKIFILLLSFSISFLSFFENCWKKKCSKKSVPYSHLTSAKEDSTDLEIAASSSEKPPNLQSEERKDDPASPLQVLSNPVQPYDSS